MSPYSQQSAHSPTTEQARDQAGRFAGRENAEPTLEAQGTLFELSELEEGSGKADGAADPAGQVETAHVPLTQQRILEPGEPAWAIFHPDLDAEPPF